MTPLTQTYSPSQRSVLNADDLLAEHNAGEDAEFSRSEAAFTFVNP